LPITPQKIRRVITVIELQSKQKKIIVLSLIQGVKAKMVEKSIVLYVKKTTQMPNAKPMSPTLLTSIALIADLLA
jgi:hypothetical protein